MRRFFFFFLLKVKVAARDSWPCRCGVPLYRAPESMYATEASPAFDPLKLDVSAGSHALRVAHWRATLASRHWPHPRKRRLSSHSSRPAPSSLQPPWNHFEPACGGNAASFAAKRPQREASGSRSAAIAVVHERWPLKQMATTL